MAPAPQANSYWRELIPFCEVLGPYLDDEGVSEIEANSDGSLFVEKHGETKLVSHSVRPSEASMFCKKMARLRGRDISEAQPLLSLQMPDGSRVSAACPPVAPGWCFTIRRHARTPWTVEALTENGTLNRETADGIIEAIQRRNTILISGATSTGKTSALSALAQFIPVDERIGILEDVAEIQVSHANVFRFEAQANVTIRDLVKHALRFTPSRIILGEVRGAEAFDLLQVLNTGHGGSLSTIHANSPLDALRRLASLAMMTDLGITEKFIKESIAKAIQVVVQLEKVGARRRVSEVVRVVGYSALTDEFLLQPIGKKGE